MTTSKSSRVALVGAGRVGTSVALLLRRSGLEIVGVSSRASASRLAAARRLACPEFNYRESLPPADIVLIGVPDAALGEVADELVPRLASDTYVCHFSGSVGTRPLDATRGSGARPCALHPVQAFPDVDTALARLPGSTWGVTCAEDDVGWADDLVKHYLKGSVVHIGEEDRPVWHAAAVMVSNGISALLSIGESMMASVGVPEANAVLHPIAVGTVANARDGGGGGATLTGPVVRGESFIIRRHLGRLSEVDPNLVGSYTQAVKMIIGAAKAAGRIEDATADEMWKEVTSR